MDQRLEELIPHTLRILRFERLLRRYGIHVFESKAEIIRDRSCPEPDFWINHSAQISAITVRWEACLTNDEIGRGGAQLHIRFETADPKSQPIFTFTTLKKGWECRPCDGLILSMGKDPKESLLSREGCISDKDAFKIMEVLIKKLTEDTRTFH